MIKLSSRLQAIQDEITRTNNIIIDVGCDHCKTAIYALQTKKASFVYNIENKKLPLLNGIKHLSEHQLLQFTKNILGEGLTSTEIKGTIDYCVISGMGGKNITQIIKHQLPQIKIKTYIVVANDHPEVIRAFLKKMNWIINNEMIIESDHEPDTFFHLIKFQPRKGCKIKNQKEIFFGPINLKKNISILTKYLIVRKKTIQSFINVTKNQQIIIENQLIDKILH